ncbi:4-hydroxylaminobenzoate lyase [Alteraurantiacibacter buctensis]|uniref:DUF4863 family protein n=1 Tax=Alteraurantiacibacter buctensis TaxID=1503981 RepID=A0A844Z2U0_9SPHN|nr:DUF4863 family protein [Alteraurantiacibacter buctensis]MXO73004.1 DUF4863 family protein [Alteraurantiacibacter buctensis]
MGERPQTPEGFVTHLGVVTDAIAGAPLDDALQARLNRDFPADGAWHADAREWVLRGCEEGWLCGREAGGIKFGRAVPAGEALAGMSVDVVEMTEIVGPHHAHPNGEIDLVIPIDLGAAFDGQGAGWKVYGPGSAHHPTVTGGKALVLYLLPGGAIEFTRG